jgi:hypothetical protein
MIMGLHGSAMLKTAYFDKGDKLAHDVLVHMFGHDGVDEYKWRWDNLPNYASETRLMAQQAHQKYQPIP